MSRRPTALGGGERSGTGPLRLLIEPSAGAMEVGHWAPAHALGWSCVQCKATFVRDTDTEEWRHA